MRIPQTKSTGTGKSYFVNENGFSLVELSIVLVIVGLMLGSLAMPLNSSIKQARYKRTAAQLTMIREALHGYLISKGRLPCPVLISAVGSISASRPTTDTSVCLIQHGVVPAQALGVIGGRDSNGGLLDGWGRPYYYAVSLNDHETRGSIGSPDWLTAGEPAAVGASELNAELNLCRKAASRQCAKSDLIANQIVWVVYSLGETDESKGIEAENRDNDTVFAVSAFSSNKEQPFDDQIIWASRSELVYWLLKANWLP